MENNIIDNIKIDFRTKQISDENLTLKFINSLNKTFHFLTNNEVMISVTNAIGGKIIQYKSSIDKSNYLHLMETNDKGFTWVNNNKFGHQYLYLNYIKRECNHWYCPSITYKTSTYISFKEYSMDLILRNLERLYNKDSVSSEVEFTFLTYVKFIKSISKRNRKKLINHLYYMDNHKGTEYKKYKRFINEYLSESLNISLTSSSNYISRIDKYKSVSEIRSDRFSKILGRFQKGIK